MPVTTPRSLFITCFFTLIAFLVASCGGGGGGGTSGGSVTPASTTGSVGILLTDQPASLDEFSGVLLTIAKIELFSEDGDKVTVYEGPPRGPFNLLKLRNESKPLAFHDRVPSGWYCKIRLTLDDLWLEFKDGSEDFHPKLPGNRKLDLNARDCIHVKADHETYIQMDMDMSKSIHIVKRGNKDEYNVRPVVFIEQVHKDFPGRLVRLEGGSIEAVNRAEGTFLLCDALPAFSDREVDHRDGCVNVRVDRDSSAFDNDTGDGNNTEGGDAIPLVDVFAPERVGRGPVTVVGFFRHTDVVRPVDHDDDDDDDDDDDGDRDDDDHEHDGDDDDYHRYAEFDAVVVELGDFLNLDGEVTSGASDLRFNMDVFPGQEYTSDDPLPVALQPAPEGGNGTKILSRDGTPLAASDINTGDVVTVDGVLIGADPVLFLNSALVIVDTDAFNKDVASGTIDRLGESGLLLEAAQFVCEPDTGPGFYVVNFDLGTDVYEVEETREGIDGDFVGIGGLEPGQRVDISGECVNGELDADTIVILPEN